MHCLTYVRITSEDATDALAVIYSTISSSRAKGLVRIAWHDRTNVTLAELRVKVSRWINICLFPCQYTSLSATVAMSSSFKFDEKGVDEPPRGYEGGRPEIDPAKERKLVRKLDFHIVPVVMMLYLFSFLDR